MVWPTDDLTKTHLDAGTDSPANARAELEALIDKVKLILAEVTAGQSIWHTGNHGNGSGLHADLLDDQHGSFYRDAGNINAGKLDNARLNTGSGNGIDSDLLDGQHGSHYLALSNATGTLTSNVDTDSLTVNGSAITNIVNITKIYAGQVNSDGTAINLPSGWTCARVSGISVGAYKITHNLGTTDYTMIVTGGDGAGSPRCHYKSKTSNDIVVYTMDAGGIAISTLEDFDFDFILLVN